MDTKVEIHHFSILCSSCICKYLAGLPNILLLKSIVRLYGRKNTFIS
jgi:hypothetical protein